MVETARLHYSVHILHRALLRNYWYGIPLTTFTAMHHDYFEDVCEFPMQDTQMIAKVFLEAPAT